MFVCVIIKSRLSNFGRKMARCECLPSYSCYSYFCTFLLLSLSLPFCCFIFFLAHLACSCSFSSFLSPPPFSQPQKPSAYPLFHFVTPSSILSQLARFFAFICAQSPRLLLCLCLSLFPSLCHLCSQFLFEMPSKYAKSPCPCRGLVPAGTVGVLAAIATRNMRPGSME